MLLAGIVAATFMGAGCAVIAADTPVMRGVTYTFYRWRRRPGARKRHCAREMR
jgi:hypothetical protein